MIDRRHFFMIVAILVTAMFGRASAEGQTSQQSPPTLAPGTLHLEPFDVPFSTLASPRAREAFTAQLHQDGPPSTGGAPVLREFYGRFNDKAAARMRALYAVHIELKTIGGVRTEIITPKDGIATENSKRILINLHGGGFMWGEGSGGEVESIPIASLGRITVITVFYRMGPENVFPAASEDVAAVYKELLKTHKPANVGIYGCSAGGILTGQAIAWFDKTHLPMPGAIGTFCGSIVPPEGDSAYIGPALNGVKGQPSPYPVAGLPYFLGADLHDPLVFPVYSPSLLAKFPPTLLISGSRDFAFSSVLKSQSALTDAKVEAELHLWDGMWHAFFMDPDLPESRKVYDVIVQFFDRHLGTK